MDSTFRTEDLAAALSSLIQFSSDYSQIDNGKSFADFYSKTLEAIDAYAVEKPSPYFAKKLQEFPIISADYIDEYLATLQRKPSNSIRSFIINMTHTHDYTAENEFTDKFRSIGSIAESLLYILNNPGFEELINEKESK